MARGQVDPRLRRGPTAGRGPTAERGPAPDRRGPTPERPGAVAGGRAGYVSFPVPEGAEFVALIEAAATHAGGMWAGHDGMDRVDDRIEP